MTVFHFQPYFSEQALEGAMKFVVGTSVMEKYMVKKKKRGIAKQKKLIYTD